LLGAANVFACDIDPAGAIAATKKNAELNAVDIRRLQIHSGDVLGDGQLRHELCRSSYDAVVANIVADVIIELVPFVKEILTHDGIFIASGILDEREKEVVAAFTENKVKIIEKFQSEGWCCIVGKV
jgi:ribosomal protein L11 methyltransferase